MYNFAMLNSPETGHLGKTLISPNFDETYGVGTRTDEDTLVQNFRHRGAVLSVIPQKQYQAFL